MRGRVEPQFFDDLYAGDPDPWKFETSTYEAAKYDATIAALDNRHYSSALELGCSIGVLTERLAAHVDELRAIDVAEQAVTRARERTRHLPHVGVERAAIPEDFPPGQFDLIVASEVLYYLDPQAFEQTLDQIDRALAPRHSSLLAVHWRHPTERYPLLGDEVHDRLAERFGAAAHTRRTPDYALDRFDLMRLVILGGGPAALAAARGYREAEGDGDVTLVTPEAGVPYRRPPLSKEYLRGELEEDDLAIEPAGWFAEHEVKIRLGDAGARLEPGTVHLRNGESLRFDACILATGAQPRRLPVPGAGDALVLRSLADARTLRARAADAETALVVGSGFIGCEAAASLAMRGLEVTLTTDEAVPQERRLGTAAGQRIAGFLEDLGVRLQLSSPVESLDPPPADLVLMAAGIGPSAELAAGAGLATHEGRIVVDERMRSADHRVLAAGDVAYAHNAAAGRHLSVEHWGEALNMGEIAGRTAAGADARWDVAPGFWSTIGTHALKYAAWGDGFDEDRLVDHGGGRFTVWYGRAGITVGVLAHDADEDYEHGRELVEAGAPLP